MTKVQTGKNTKNQQKDSISKTSRFSVFIIAEKLFGIELSNVDEVITLPKISKVPSSPRNILGVFSLRGTILTLIEVNETLGLPVQEIDEEKMVLIVDHQNQRIGIIVEKVLDVVNVEESEIQLPSREMSHKMARNIIGYYEKEGIGSINLLNLAEVLSSENFS